MKYTGDVFLGQRSIIKSFLKIVKTLRLEQPVSGNLQNTNERWQPVRSQGLGNCRNEFCCEDAF